MELGWYATPEGIDYLRKTEGGMFSFVWVARYNDGMIMRQFEPKIMKQALDNPDFVVPKHLVQSVSKLDVRKTQEFLLLPTALSRKVAFWLKEVRLKIDLKAGEKFISYWLTDYALQKTDPRRPTYLRRHVVGISKTLNGTQAKFLTVVSVGGSITVCTNDDQSFEGE